MAVWRTGEDGKAIKWKGGRVARGKHGDVFHIERMVDGQMRGGSLGPGIGLERAELEWQAFLADPIGYKTPPQRAKEAAEAKFVAEQVKAEQVQAAVIIDDTMLDEFAEAQTNGYGNHKPRSKKHVINTLHTLSQWAEGPLKGRDLRHPHTKLTDLKEGLRLLKVKKTTKAARRHPKRPGRGAEQKRISSLKALTCWLRHEGRLTSHDDPTVDLICLQYVPPDEDKILAKVYEPEHLQQVFVRIGSQACRDVFRVRAMTGLHVSEIERVAKKDGGRIEKLEGLGEIAGRVIVRHKSGRTHVQTVDAETLAALQRLQEAKRVMTPHKVIGRIRKAAKAAGVEPIVIAHLRHTFVTLCRRAGRIVTAPNTEALTREQVMRTVGHTSTRTTAIYDASTCPPMMVPPIRLVHPDDPILPGVRHLRAVS
jgi:integrase